MNKERPREFEIFIFDLDNTLYDETIYLFAAYRSIAEWLGNHEGLSSDDIFQFLKNNFLKGERRRLFNEMELHFGLKNTHMTEYLNMLRNVQLRDKIAVAPAMSSLLKTLFLKNKKIVIFTNGNPAQQQNKINQINWPIPIDYMEIVLANLKDPKPSCKAIEYLLNHSGYPIEKFILIGDGEVDEHTAKNCNMPFLHVTDYKLDFFKL